MAITRSGFDRSFDAAHALSGRLAGHPQGDLYLEALTLLQSTYTDIVTPAIASWGFRFEHYQEIAELHAEIVRMSEEGGPQLAQHAPVDDAIARSWVDAATARAARVRACIVQDARAQVAALLEVARSRNVSAEDHARMADLAAAAETATTAHDAGALVTEMRSVLHGSET